jgi:AraC-like DNA-binding protein
MREYRCHNLSVQDFARLTGRSPSSFNRDFKRQFGTTPHQWLIDARLDRAMELIQSTQMTVTEVALEIGYDNVSHFIKAFKTKYGQTPKQARSKITC